MMRPSLRLFLAAFVKADAAYGTIASDLRKAIAITRNDPTTMDKSISAMKMRIPRALLWKRIVEVEKLIPTEQ